LEDCAWVDNILASGLVTGIESSFENSPKTTILYKNYPNPFNPSTEIKFYISSNNDVKLSVFNSNGQLVRELLNDKLNKGMHLLKFNAENLNSGVYYYILETENSKLSEKMLLIK
jgi:flagellar hook assembly protein FlgD